MLTKKTQNENKIAVVDFENFLVSWNNVGIEGNPKEWVIKLTKEYSKVMLVSKRKIYWKFGKKVEFQQLTPLDDVDTRELSHAERSYDDCYCVFLVNCLLEQGNKVSFITRDRLRGLFSQSKQAIPVKVNGERVFYPSLITERMIQNALSFSRIWGHNFALYEDYITDTGTYHNGTWYPPKVLMSNI